jgi:hypothetical protein
MENRFDDLRFAGAMIRTGTGLCLLGLGAGLGLLLCYVCTTQTGLFSPRVAASLVDEMRPLVEPVLDVEGFGVALGALGLTVLKAKPRPNQRALGGMPPVRKTN